MASVKINEIDNTIFSPVADYNENIVYIPGNAITGPIGVPTLCETYESFVNIFGAEAPNNDDDTIGTAWDYAANLLLVGTFSVLFERVAPDNEDGTSTAVKATSSIEYEGQSVGKVTELYGGSFGNSLSYSVLRTDTEIRFRTYKNIGTTNVLLEDVKIMKIDKNLVSGDIREKLVEIIGAGYNTSYVTITVENTDIFDLSNITNKKLSGGADPSDMEVAKAIPAVYEKLKDKYLYDVKFVTSGNAYNMQVEESGVTSDIDVVNPMKDVAESRQDCTVFANIPIGMDKADVQDWVKSTVNSSYVTVHAPWCYVNLTTGTTKWMAPSFIALWALARQVKLGYFIWQAPAGVNRSRITSLVRPEYEVGGATLDLWQNDKAPFVNPIMYLLKYGYTIFGQRTTFMVDGSETDKSSLQELGVRITANEIKKKIRNICVGLSFEANNIRTWNTFRGQLIPYLDNMKLYGGLEAFKVVMDETTTTPADINANRIVGSVHVVISRAAEDFVINFVLEPSGTTFDEE